LKKVTRPNRDLASAIALAAEAHVEQFDFSGTPYILHCMRVAMKLPNAVLKTIGILHDVVEDTKISLEDLEELGFDGRVLDAVDALTRRDKETYEDYIERVIKNRDATFVKLADLEDNMDVTRLPYFGKYESKRLAKYLRTYAKLKSS